jgi:predicted nucleotidyltransferase
MEDAGLSEPPAHNQARKKQRSLPEPFTTVLDKVVQDLRSDLQIEAIFLGGSLALGQALPRSDLDLVVIKSNDVQVTERYAHYVEDVQVQVIAGPPRQFDIWLEQDRPTGTVIRQLAEGRLLFDRSGLGVCYRARAQDVVAAGLEPMSTPQIRARRFLLTELLDDVADCACDPPRARWLMSTGLAFVVETAFLWNRQWTPKGKRALEEIERLDPALACLCHEVLTAMEPQAQHTAFESLVAHVLAPLGGELREPWTRPPEPVPQPEGKRSHAHDES